MNTKMFFRVISIVLINSFLLLDAVWAGGDQLMAAKKADCLSPAIQINNPILVGSFQSLEKRMVTYRWEFIPSKDMQRVLQQRLEESQKKQNNPAPESKPINNSNQKMSFFNSTREMFMGTGLALMAQAIVLMPIVIKFFDKMNEVRDGYIAGSFFAAMLGAAAYFIGVLPLERIGRFIKSALNKQDNLTEETQSGTIKSIGIISLFSAGFVALSASLGWTADGSIQETAGWIGWAMEHWEISGMGIIGGTVLFLMAWKRYFPVSWYLWRLNSRFEKSRSNAAKALGKLGDKRAVESLIGKLYDENASVCEAVATALGKLGDKRAIKALMNLSTNSNLSDIGINRAITMAINKSITSKEELFDVYLKLLTSSNRWTRINAVTGLEELGDKRAIGPLLEKLKDADTQWHAHGALNTLGASKQELVKGFLEALRSGDYGARRDAIRNLKQFGDIVDKRTLKPLLVNFYISDLNYHPTAAARELALLGDKIAIISLEKLLANTSKTSEIEEELETYIVSGDFREGEFCYDPDQCNHCTIGQEVYLWAPAGCPSYSGPGKEYITRVIDNPDYANISSAIESLRSLPDSADSTAVSENLSSPASHPPTGKTFEKLPSMQETGKKTVEVYFNAVKQLEQEKAIHKMDHQQVRVEMTDLQKEKYLNAIKQVLAEENASVVTPAILFKAAEIATQGDTSNVKARIGLQPGTMNPLHYGHISASLAGIISEKLDMVVLANGGTVPDKPYAASAEIRNEMARRAVNEEGQAEKLGLADWLQVTPIRAQTVEMFEQDSATLSLAGTKERAEELGIKSEEELRRFNMDMAAFIWMFKANPKVTWVYLVGSDKVAEYGKKEEKGLVRDTLNEAKVKIVYFERTGQEVDYESQIKKYDWLDALWKTTFKKSDVGSFADLAAVQIRKALSDKDTIPAKDRLVGNHPLDQSIPEGVIDYITADTPEGRQLRYLYPLENREKDAEKFSKNEKLAEALTVYQEILAIVEKEKAKPVLEQQASIAVLDSVIKNLRKKINAIEKEKSQRMPGLQQQAKDYQLAIFMKKETIRQLEGQIKQQQLQGVVRQAELEGAETEYQQINSVLNELKEDYARANDEKRLSTAKALLPVITENQGLLDKVLARVDEAKRLVSMAKDKEHGFSLQLLGLRAEVMEIEKRRAELVNKLSDLTGLIDLKEGRITEPGLDKNMPSSMALSLVETAI